MNQRSNKPNTKHLKCHEVDLDGLNQMKPNKSRARHLKCINEMPWDISKGWKFIGPKTLVRTNGLKHR